MVSADKFTTYLELLQRRPVDSLEKRRKGFSAIPAELIHYADAVDYTMESKPSKKSKPWMTPHVRAKIRTRNRVCRTIHQNQQEWIDACCEATEAINEAKTESWKDLLQDAMSNSDGPNMWKVIQGLNGTPDANSPNEAMSHDDRTIIDIKSNAKRLHKPLRQAQKTQHVTSRPQHQPKIQEACQRSC